MYSRVHEAIREKAEIVDVDGSYMFRKHKAMTELGFSLAPLPLPTLPLSGWEAVTQHNFTVISKKMPSVSPTYLYTVIQLI